MSEHYSFTTHWQTNAPLPEVWDLILQSQQWPEWWKGIASVEETTKGDEQGIGSVRIYKIKSPLFYTLTFQLTLTDRIEHTLLSGKANGELEGTGTWKFEEHNGITDIKCHWNVRTNILWMNALSFLLKPLFKFNHSIVMRWGAESLAKRLNTAVNILP